MTTRIHNSPTATPETTTPAPASSKKKTDPSASTSSPSPSSAGDSATQQEVLDIMLQTNINMIMSIASQPIKSAINTDPTDD